ncbi:MAG TPA: hypothetical protein DEO70_05695 [Bacteroidales bacterium]|nr:MAG: hypothetical protein A2X11_17005 [Bacteroidetes bacterium GWE2_42_24]OFY25183.1 MAG: hypothetical protein A2X09_05170 [Bacteroidetes bacterium GWF2_43_11]PKP17636.1 MAG: hypothetical protein CVU06_12945 [Bacteroidetes bacterium HGW-Bacteroidetes-22]HBZ66313.1 hypothetical protein [Bacteroidales bacterium]
MRKMNALKAFVAVKLGLQRQTEGEVLLHLLLWRFLTASILEFAYSSNSIHFLLNSQCRGRISMVNTLR